MCEREKLLRCVQIHSFACIDVSLYLDGHPTCQNALAYFQKHKQLRDEAAALYNEKFGPLNIAQNDSLEKWHWVCGPWPWELEV